MECIRGKGTCEDKVVLIMSELEAGSVEWVVRKVVEYMDPEDDALGRGKIDKWENEALEFLCKFSGVVMGDKAFEEEIVAAGM